MLRIVPHTAPRVGRPYEHLADGFELHLLQVLTVGVSDLCQVRHPQHESVN